MLLVDTHSHIFLEEFDQDRNEVVERALANGVERLVLPNIDKDSLSRLKKTCQEYPGFCFPMVGLHPTSVDGEWRSQLEHIRSFRPSLEGVVGIGEIGMDLYWDRTFLSEQMEALEAQVRWALEENLPVSIHCRDAYPELLEVLAPFKDTHLRGIFHCFSGSADDLDRCLSFDGMMIGVGGSVTYKKSSLAPLLPTIPLDRMVLETDCPYLSPIPKRGTRNESSFVIHTASFVARYLEMDLESLALQTTENARRLFNI